MKAWSGQWFESHFDEDLAEISRLKLRQITEKACHRSLQMPNADPPIRAQICREGDWSKTAASAEGAKR